MYPFINTFCRSCVRIVSSHRSGMGKSLYVQRLAEQLKRISTAKPVHVIIPLHGPVVTADTVLNFFLDHYSDPSCCIYHLDIAPNVCYCSFLCLSHAGICVCRFCGRLTPFCLAFLSSEASMTAKEGCGTVIPISSTLWKSLCLLMGTRTF